tara:strand:- start:785 stop:1159 length:375 start_codon:yes stop_codon:yes gene_type:complete
MAVTHAMPVRNGIADYVTGQIDVSGVGKILFQTAGAAAVANLPFSATAFGAAASAVATANAITDDTNCTAGTVAIFAVQQNDNTAVFSGSVTATGGGGDIILSSVAIGQGDTISISSLTYEAPQ